VLALLGSPSIPARGDTNKCLRERQIGTPPARAVRIRAPKEQLIAANGPMLRHYCGSRKLCKIISGDACGCRDFPIHRFRMGHLSGEIGSVNVFRTSDDQVGGTGLPSYGDTGSQQGHHLKCWIYAARRSYR